MPDLLGGVCLFALGVFLFALVGHGIWVAGAAIVRAIFDAAEPSGAESACPVCGWRLVPGNQKCLACGWAVPTRPKSPGEDASLEALVNDVRRLHEQGVIDAGACERLLTAVHAEQESLRQRTTASADATRA